MNWLLDTMRFRHPMPWFGPAAPPPHVFRPGHLFFQHHMPAHHHQFFTNFMHPIVDQLVIDGNSYS